MCSCAHLGTLLLLFFLQMSFTTSSSSISSTSSSVTYSYELSARIKNQFDSQFLYWYSIWFSRVIKWKYFALMKNSARYWNTVNMMDGNGLKWCKQWRDGDWWIVGRVESTMNGVPPPFCWGGEGGGPFPWWLPCCRRIHIFSSILSSGDRRETENC